MAKAANDPAAEAEFKQPTHSSSKASSPTPRKSSQGSPRSGKAPPVGEDSQYYLAETQFQRENYVRCPR